MFDRLAALFDLTGDRVRTIANVPGRGVPPLGRWAGARRGKRRIGSDRHKHLGEERVMVLQGQRVEAGQLVVMPDGSEHAFRVVSKQELLYAVVVGEIELADGTRAP